MAKKLKTAKPLLSLKRDFVESLDAFINEAFNLSWALKTAIDLEQVSGTAKARLSERLAALEAVMDSGEGK